MIHILLQKYSPNETYHTCMSIFCSTGVGAKCHTVVMHACSYSIKYSLSQSLLSKASICVLLYLLVFDLPTDYCNTILISNINQRNTRTDYFLSYIAVLATQSKESSNQKCR